MFTLNLTLGAIIYTVSAFVLVFGLWLYYDIRDRRLYDAERRKVTFHCIRCDKLYSAKIGTEECDCPQCKFKNQKLKF